MLKIYIKQVILFTHKLCRCNPYLYSLAVKTTKSILPKSCYSRLRHLVIKCNNSPHTETIQIKTISVNDLTSLEKDIYEKLFSYEKDNFSN